MRRDRAVCRLHVATFGGYPRERLTELLLPQKANTRFRLGPVSKTRPGLDKEPGLGSDVIF